MVHHARTAGKSQRGEPSPTLCSGGRKKKENQGNRSSQKNSERKTSASTAMVGHRKKKSNPPAKSHAGRGGCVEKGGKGGNKKIPLDLRGGKGAKKKNFLLPRVGQRKNKLRVRRNVQYEKRIEKQESPREHPPPKKTIKEKERGSGKKDFRLLEGGKLQ